MDKFYDIKKLCHQSDAISMYLHGNANIFINIKIERTGRINFRSRL